MRYIKLIERSLVSPAIALLAITAVTGASFSPLAEAEAVSKPCPFSCATEKLDPGECADWREGDICFVEHPSLAGSSADGDPRGSARLDADLERDIVLLNEVIKAGSEKSIELKERPLARVDVVIARQGDNTNTQLEVRTSETGSLGGPQQIDQNSAHVVSFATGAGAEPGKELILHALNGAVKVESVHLFYEKDAEED